MNLGKNIKEARKAAGVTQKELAERLQVYQKDISRWENNELTPNAITLAKICRELNASADQILELNSDNERLSRRNYIPAAYLRKRAVKAWQTKKEAGS